MLNVSCLENHTDQQQWLDLDAFNDYEYLTSDASSHPLHPQISMLVLTARAQAAKKNQINASTDATLTLGVRGGTALLQL